MRARFNIRSAGLLFLVGGFMVPSSADAADFYAGRDIELIIGSAPGGGYDTYARLLARHLPNHIAGKPNIIAKNMPGAGSSKAAMYIYSVAAKDGTAIAGIFPGAIVEPLLYGRTELQYDPTKFTYLASADSGTRICMTMAGSPTKTLHDAKKRTTVIGASQAGGSTRDYAAMLNNLVGTKFEIIAGYKGSSAILFAMERNEVEGMCGFDWTSFQAQRPDWVREGKVNILVQVGPDPEPDLIQRKVPEVWTFLKDENARQIVELVVAQQTFGRPYVAPPGTPEAQTAILRNAFSAALADRNLSADAQKARLAINPASGKKVQDLVKKLYEAPKSVVRQAQEAMGISGKQDG